MFLFCCGRVLLFSGTEFKRKDKNYFFFYFIHSEIFFIWSWPLLSLLSHLPWKLGICFFIWLFLKKWRQKSPFPFFLSPHLFLFRKLSIVCAPPPSLAYCIFILHGYVYFVFSPFCWLSERVISLSSYTYNKLILSLSLFIFPPCFVYCFFLIIIIIN